jgi:hypothetical protein
MWDNTPFIYLVAGIGLAVITGTIYFFRLSKLNDSNQKKRRLFPVLNLIVIGVGAFIIAFLVNALSVQVEGAKIGGVTGTVISIAGWKSVVTVACTAAYYFMGAGFMALDTLLGGK